MLPFGASAYLITLLYTPLTFIEPDKFAYFSKNVFDMPIVSYVCCISPLAVINGQNVNCM